MLLRRRATFTSPGESYHQVKITGVIFLCVTVFSLVSDVLAHNVGILVNPDMSPPLLTTFSKWATRMGNATWFLPSTDAKWFASLCATTIGFNSMYGSRSKAHGSKLLGFFRLELVIFLTFSTLFSLYSLTSLCWFSNFSFSQHHKNSLQLLQQWQQQQQRSKNGTDPSPKRKRKQDDEEGVAAILKKAENKEIELKLLCGADLLESFGTPG